MVSWHVLAMFGPSFFTGGLIARFGASRWSGPGSRSAPRVTLPHFSVALVLLGLGWGFGFIGATAMLASSSHPAERGRVQGMNDFAVFGLVCVASLASGGLINCTGGDPVAGWTAVNLCDGAVPVAAGAALVWLALIVRRPVTSAR